ncbi:HlyD family secretion protein [Camelimonas abortus]|uniref:HlyD family secretion protein n=1 Tax=Camelimonas abortus TaxID=1017184 RepID=A0ABV7LDD7_9HYPH
MTDTVSRPSLTPEQRFRRSVFTSAAAAALLLLYAVIADRYMPVTPEARALYDTVRVAPEVSGAVVRVNVANNQPVEAGQVLFEIDPSRYALAVRAAQLAIEHAGQANRQLDAEIAEAEAAVASARAAAADQVRQARRKTELSERMVVPVSMAETAAARRDEALAALQAAQARLSSSLVRRGDRGPDNLAMREARNRLAIAQRELASTTVVAAQDGVVANMWLRPGHYVAAGAPVLTVVGRTPTIVADFREKALTRVRPGDRALVSFDALPGQVFAGRVISIEAGVAQGQVDPDGMLARTVETDRWIRRAQRVRVNVRLDAPPRLVSGARATVQLVPRGSAVFRFLARIQIVLFAQARHVY